jgi:hypothetical protein
VAAAGTGPRPQLRNSMRVVMRAFEQHYLSCMADAILDGVLVKKALGEATRLSSSASAT